jgi:RNA polymerase sigma factor (sigma-70 family)
VNAVTRIISAGSQVTMKKVPDSLDGFVSPSADTPAAYEVLNRFLLRRVPAEDASDLIQDAYVRFLQAVQTERSQVVRDPSGYIFGITRRLVIDYFRRRRSGDLPFDEKGTPVESANDVEREVDARLEMERAFGALSSQERELVLLNLSGYSYTEIAKRVGLSPGIVKRYLIRARVNIGMQLTGRQSAKV